jgi:uncharacterized protein
MNLRINIEQARTWYTGADAVHDFDHVLRVYKMAERLGPAENADMEIVRAAALLHDAQGSTPGGDERLSHHLASAAFAADILTAEGWPLERIEAVQHCIRAHRYRDDREPPETIEAKVLFDADKLDVLGAIGVARVVGYALLAGQPIIAEPSEQFLKTGVKLPGEPHSAYHEYLFKLRNIKDRLFTASARKLAVERHAYLTQYFEQLKGEFNGDW